MVDRARWGAYVHAVVPVPLLAELAAAAEQRGAAVVIVPDEGTDRDVYVTLTAMALATERILLATGITNPHSRHPVATAAAFASLAEVAPGRVVVGLGAGGTMVFGPMGLRPARPFTSLVESVDVIDGLLAGRSVDHDGTFRTVGAAIPWSPGRLPIAITGRGPRAEGFAKTRADWVLVAGKPLERLPGLAAEVREAARADGRDPLIVWSPMAAWTDEGFEHIRPYFAFMTVDMPPALQQRLGVTEEQVRRIRETLQHEGLAATAPLVPQSVIDAYSITGTRDVVIERLAATVAAFRPDLVVFDLLRHTTEFVAELADLAADVGLVA